MIRSIKGKLLLSLGVTLVVYAVLVALELVNGLCSEVCPITGSCFESCTSPMSVLLPYLVYLAIPLFIIIFLVLHLVSKYK